MSYVPGACPCAEGGTRLGDPDATRPAVVCDAATLASDAVTIEALARLALCASRLGCVLRIEGASGELRDLVILCGLGEVLRVEP
jgi:hypothetical protein